ncbi:MAG: methyltransferase [Cryomorphaceae bacterium]|nr:methyltransferase [Cryomorphaceae bacterium]
MAKDKLLPFRFKHFEIRHDRCAMKVGTDGLLLGAWVNVGNHKSIIDVGAGSGLISLMLAQRSPDSLVLGVEIDEQAYQQALENVENSSFKSRIRLIHNSILNADVPQGPHLVVSNPPFFTGGLKSDDAKRTMARHDDELSLHSLLFKAASMIDYAGVFALIWPFDRREELLDEAERVGLFLRRETSVLTTKHKHPSRVLAEFTRAAHSPDVDEIVIQENGKYTETYTQLLKDFYLDF